MTFFVSHAAIMLEMDVTYENNVVMSWLFFYKLVAWPLHVVMVVFRAEKVVRL